MIKQFIKKNFDANVKEVIDVHIKPHEESELELILENGELKVKKYICQFFYIDENPKPKATNKFSVNQDTFEAILEFCEKNSINIIE